MINDSAEVVKKRCPISSPAGVMISEWSRESTVFDKFFQVSLGGSKY
jgi:hypothetical protein